MTKKQRINRKKKWRNITLNKANIDEYLKDLYNDTSGNYITQGVSFNKDDNFQMSLLRNALIAHGSFSGFVKSLLHAHFDKHGKLDDTIWQPNEIIEEELEDDEDSSSSSPSPLVEENENNDDDMNTDDSQEETTATTEQINEHEIKQEPETKEEPKDKESEKKQDRKRTTRKTTQKNGVSNAERASNYSL